MDQETHQARRHRHGTTVAPQEEESYKKEDDELLYSQDKDDGQLFALATPAGWFVQFIAFQVELIAAAVLYLFSPFAALLSESKAVPARVARRGVSLLRRVAFGFLGAAYAAAVLIAVLVVAVVLGVGVVRLWVDEPVHAHKSLYFDYTNPHPTAVVRLGGGPKTRAVPPGHTVRVLLVLVMPESDYNRRIGVFQVTAEVMTHNGDIIASSSQPCILRFRSLPIRLTRTFLMGIPLLVGICSESQTITMEILQYKESRQKTELLRVRLKPRALTTDLPQLYASEMVISSKLPWGKEIVHNWKWTFYVWISLHMYILLLIILLCCVKPSVFFRPRSYPIEKPPPEVGGLLRDGYGREGETSDEFLSSMRRWRERRSKRKAQLVHARTPELVESSASGVAGGGASEVIDDSGDFAASESSECVGG
ncbi:seipin-1 [Typha angustifolia]|uniref:seipin-1 n=1 Tax=Typha angustifolia TaxID=59011 RepID=UPI003C2D40D5